MTQSHDALTVKMLDAVALHARVQPRHTACVELASGRTLDYAQVDQRIHRAVQWLEARFRCGDRVAWLGRNSLDLLITHLACGRAGMIFVPLNWRLAVPELLVILSDCEPALLLHDSEFLEVAQTVSANLPKIARVEVPEVTRYLDSSASVCADTRFGGSAERTAMLLYTSGTTGRPKGAMLSERNIYFASTNMAVAACIDRHSVFLCDAPMFHVIGLVAAARTTLLAGGTLLISSGFDPGATLARLRDRALGITHYFCVPQMAEMMRTHPSFRPDDLTRLRALCTGGAPHAAATVRRWLDLGVMLLDGYGMSEAGSVTLMPPGDLDLLRAKAGSCGKRMLATEIRLVGAEGHDVPVGEPGEIWMRGVNLISGYWRQSEEVAQRFAGGWFRTGDVARIDEDGFYYLIDRKNDMFISGGENIYPAEIEAVIRSHPSVLDVAVFGVPDERWGEVGCMYVVSADSEQFRSEVLLAHCQAHLARYKVPKHVVRVEAIPRTASGKVQKHRLREEYLRAAGHNS
jgi:fatty-acyl-CoA synthase